MINKFNFDLNYLHIFSDKRYTQEFASRIYKVIMTENILIALTEKGLRNIHAIDEFGNQLWTIEDIRITDNLPEDAGAGYANVYLDEQGALWCGNFIGESHRVDPKTGEILEHRWTK